ncbi:Pancreatic lipase-related protein 2 [Halotydeus destructor]|nr:Pancreatic lipase-related protein 2 [Halotydeus destructor]
MTSLFYIVNVAIITKGFRFAACDIPAAGNGSEPLNPTMIELVNHHRLLGFVAMMDEPLHHLNMAPEPIGSMDTKFTLFDKCAMREDGTLRQGKAISYLGRETQFTNLQGKYDKVYVVSHGFQEILDSRYKDLIGLLLKYKQSERPAVMAVDWGKAAMFITRGDSKLPELVKSIYGQAATNAVVVGREVALMCFFLTKLEVIPRRDIHLIGFGLGAQVMHFAGQWYTRLEDVERQGTGGLRGIGKIGRITGLDPSAIEFQGYGTASKLPYLNEQDAEFVDIIHTSSVKNGGDYSDVVNNRLGMSVLTGHVDFYPNGGQEQPFCKSFPRCSHERALHYFKASLTADTNVSKRLFALGANSYQDYLEIRPGGRPSFFGSMFKQKPKVSSSFGATYMGIQAMALLKPQTEQAPYGLYLDFALDNYLKPVAVQTAGLSEIQLVDTLKPNVLTEDGFDFSKFPPYEPKKKLALHPQELPGCGRFLAPPTGSGRVHFGLEPYVGQFPWNVCIGVLAVNAKGETYILEGCTGSLIADDFVVTAAHCFKDYALNKEGHPQLRLDNRPIYLLFGSDCRRPLLHQEIPVRQDVTVFLHPRYAMESKTPTKVDIALIKLVKPIPAAMLPLKGQLTNITILNTVCWRTAVEYDYSDTCQELYFAGYGANDQIDITSSETLRWTVMKLISERKKTHGETVVTGINAEHHQTRNTCPGDSGGPLTHIVKTSSGPVQLYDRASPYTAILVGTVMGGRPPCNRIGKKTTFCKVGEQQVHGWLDKTLADNVGPPSQHLQAAPVDYDISSYLKLF